MLEICLFFTLVRVDDELKREYLAEGCDISFFSAPFHIIIIRVVNDTTSSHSSLSGADNPAAINVLKSWQQFTGKLWKEMQTKSLIRFFRFFCRVLFLLKFSNS